MKLQQIFILNNEGENVHLPTQLWELDVGM